MKKLSKKPNIWDEAISLKSSRLSATKVHVSLRLDPKLYRMILSEQKQRKDRTVTATIERILSNHFAGTESEALLRILVTVRNMLVHSALQDDIISAVAKTVDDSNLNRLLTERANLQDQSEALAEMLKAVDESKLKAIA
ncbi:MAG: hypothetical protein WA431_02210 [Candidatus Cybelea sp.]